MIEHTCVGKTYYIAYRDDKSVVHQGEAEDGQHIATGLDHLEYFHDEAEWVERKAELGIE